MLSVERLCSTYAGALTFENLCQARVAASDLSPSKTLRWWTRCGSLSFPHICVCVCVCARARVNEYAWEIEMNFPHHACHTCTRAHAHTHTHTHTHARARAHTHTHTHTGDRGQREARSSWEKGGCEERGAARGHGPSERGRS